VQILSEDDPKEKRDEDQDGESEMLFHATWDRTDSVNYVWWTQHLLNPAHCSYLFSKEALANSDPVRDDA
jgi:hypothetical protein